MSLNNTGKEEALEYQW